MKLDVLSAGAAQALVTRLAEAFKAETGIEVAGTFGAIGAMKERLLAGAPADVVLLSSSMIRDLVREGRLRDDSVHDIGTVLTGIAVPVGRPRPDIASAGALEAALLKASAIFIPDPATATAGVHFTKVLDQLGIRSRLQDRIRPFANGHAAMTAMAREGDGAPIGCTQVTEIMAVTGVELVGGLPPGLELATAYAAAIGQRSAFAAPARRFIDHLCANEHSALRESLGFAAAR